MKVTSRQRETRRMQRQLAVRGRNIERKTVPAKLVNILDECFLWLRSIGLRVQNSANPFQFRMTQYLFL